MAQLILEPGDNCVDVVRRNAVSGALTPAFSIGIDAQNFGSVSIGMGINGFRLGVRPDGEAALQITHDHVAVHWAMPLLLPIQPDGSVHIKGNDGKTYSLSLTEVL